MRKLVLLFSLVLLGCGESKQAARATVSMEMAALSYSRNMSNIVEAFIADYRKTALKEVDADNAAAFASVTKPDGTVNALTAKALMIRKVEQYSAVEREVLKKRRKLLEAGKDIEHLLKYSEALQEYFQQKKATVEILEQSTDQMLTMLERILGAKKPAETVP